MNHDLIEIAGAYISLTAINAISNELALSPGEPDVVHIDYGQGSRLTFAGDAATVMQIIDAWCEERTRVAVRAG